MDFKFKKGIPPILLKLFWLVAIGFSFPTSSVQATESWSAQWIGFSEESRPNTWICFQKEVTLSDTPKTAIAWIACDSKYWLWINGKMVVFEGQLKRGPSPNSTWFDEVDLASHLQKGPNKIAILVWYWGKEGFSHQSSGKAGLLFQAEVDGIHILSDASWKGRIHPAYGTASGLPANFRLPESNILFDARKEIGPWMNLSERNAEWETVAVLGNASAMPWGPLVKRPIPLWKNSGIRAYTKITTVPIDLKTNRIVAELPYNAQITPYLKVEAEEGEKIEICSDTYDLFKKRDPLVCAEYITRKGVQDYESLGWMNGHQIHYTVPTSVKVLELGYRETGYDADVIGSFSSDDPFLNQLWEEARRTLYVTMRDTYMDCPDRERGLWWGDAVTELSESFYVFDSLKGPLLTQKCMLDLVRWQRPDGALFSPVPTGNWNKELPLQMLASVGWYGFWTYYWYSGDLNTISIVYPAVKKYLELWQLGADGLVVHRAGQWDWSDWGKNADVAILDNAWFYLALKGAAAMAKSLGLNDDALGFEEKMQTISSAFNRTFWQKDYYRSPLHTGEIDDRSNAMAVIAGFADPSQFPAIRKVLREKIFASPYMEKYVLESLLMMNAPEEAVERIKTRYGKMMKDPFTTLWENFSDNPQRPGGGTNNHAWSGGPLTLLSQCFAGIRPTSPGWKTFEVHPCPGPLQKIEAHVPTPYGLIAFCLEMNKDKGMIDLTVPQGIHANVIAPDLFKSSFTEIKLNGKSISPEGLSSLGEGTHHVEFTVLK